jgi:3-dehydroquinate dehydratase / shikimate dehydrogenase
MTPFGSGLRRLCAVVAEPTAASMARQIRRALREAATVELRLDWLATDTERARLLRWLARNRPRSATFLATCRRRGAGGLFSGYIQAQLYWLIQARQAGCQWCDLEVETVRKLPDQSVRDYAVPPKVMLSIHDFERTPALTPPFRMARHSEFDVIKIATHARTITDSVRLLRFLRGTKNCIASPMGEMGLPARILALREGSVLAYAPVAQPTAPGQVSLREMKHLYRAHNLNRSTKVYGVIGDPVGHSLSPLLHNSGFVARQINAVYLPFLVHDLRDFLKVLPEFGVCGFSITLPHKQTILKYLQECDPLAADIGAVNTVQVHRDGSLSGYNTDYVGVLRALAKKLQLSGSRVLIFGSGGSARATAFALARAGASVCVCARRDRVARELARAVDGEVVPRRALRAEFFDAILNTTPIGMYPNTGISPLTPRELHCRIVMDLIYRPEKTHLLKLAARQGIATVTGVDMFLAQGFAQWEIWMKRRAPEAIMRRAVLGALRRAEEPHSNAIPRRSR